MDGTPQSCELAARNDERLNAQGREIGDVKEDLRMMHGEVREGQATLTEKIDSLGDEVRQYASSNGVDVKKAQVKAEKENGKRLSLTQLLRGDITWGHITLFLLFIMFADKLGDKGWEAVVALITHTLGG